MASKESDLEKNIFAEFFKEHDNVLLSPPNIQTLLLTFSEYKSGQKSIEIENHKKILKILNSLPNVSLHMTNKMYLPNSKKSKKNLEGISEIASVDFKDSKKVEKAINEWVSKSTKGKIDQVVQAKDLDGNLESLSISAIYFKGTN